METGIVTLKSVGRYFAKRVPPIGVWLASLMWNDEDVGLIHLPSSGESESFTEAGHNIGADVYAILIGLREAQQIGLPVEVHTANEPNSKTIPEWFDEWESSGWKTKKGKGKTPENLEWWKEIKEITTSIPVTWHKREKGPIDTVKEYEALRDMIEDQDNAFWSQRAFERDRR